MAMEEYQASQSKQFGDTSAKGAKGESAPGTSRGAANSKALQMQMQVRIEGAAWEEGPGNVRADFAGFAHEGMSGRDSYVFYVSFGVQIQRQGARGSSALAPGQPLALVPH